jgi:hypothetical protein
LALTCALGKIQSRHLVALLGYISTGLLEIEARHLVAESRGM